MNKTLLIPGALLPMLALGSVQAKQRPNFVIIVADDMGYADASVYGSDYIQTPNIDRMAKEGMMFTDFHSNGAVSSPTRCGLLTGRYQQRAGLEGVVLVTDVMERIEPGLQPDEVTFAKVLADNGYNTALIGKWHLGYMQKYNPVNHGFGKYIGFKSGNVDYQSHRNGSGEADWWDGLELKDLPGYTTTLLTDLSCDYIRENREKPFCLYIAHAAPHSPLQGPSDPSVRDGKVNRDKAGNRENKEIYKEMVEELDNGVGRVLATLKECGIGENTFVVFFSDNGPVINYGGSALPYRGAKGSPYEGGHRVPGIFYMPGKVKAGSVCDQTVMGFDLFPTMVQMAGAKYDDSAKPLDGVSLLPLIHGKKLADRTLFWGVNPNASVAREGNWKLVRRGKEFELYDLVKDPSETTDLALSHPEVVEGLKEKLSGWAKSVYSEVPDQIHQDVKR